jgi:hypothetical protein
VDMALTDKTRPKCNHTDQADQADQADQISSGAWNDAATRRRRGGIA